MQQDPKQIILEILTLIDFTGNKEEYIDEFMRNCNKQATNDALSSLSNEKLDELKQKLSLVQEEDKKNSLMKEYITPEEYYKAYTKTVSTAFDDFLQAIEPTLSEEQSDKLQNYLNSLSVNQATQTQ